MDDLLALPPPPQESADADWLQCAHEILSDFDDRERRILGERVLRTHGAKPTLEDLGSELGITRERVRQIERGAKERLMSPSRRAERQTIMEEARRVRVELGPMFTESELRSSLDPKAQSAEHSPEVDLLLLIANRYDHCGDLFVDRVFDEQVLRRIPRALQSEEVTEETLRIVLGDLGVQDQHLDAAFARIGRLHAINGRLVRWTGSLGDKAALTLAVRGSPMSADELIETIGEGARNSLVNLLGSDPRFVRRSATRYGLTEWGGDPYEGIAKAMIDELRRSGGSLPLATLSHRLHERFDINPNSVTIMAGTSPLFVEERPWVRLRREDEPYIPDTALEESGACMVIDGEWSWRRTVDHDVLRGSGLPLPEPFAANLGVLPSGRREFESEYGKIVIAWATQDPGIGSIRRAAEALDSHAGDLLFVRAADDRVDFRVARETDLEPPGATDELLLRLGQAPQANNWQAASAEAIGLSAHADRAEIDSLLEARKDRTVLRLFRSAVRESEVS